MGIEVVDKGFTHYVDIVRAVIFAELDRLRAYLVLMVLMPYATSNLNQLIRWPAVIPT